MSSFLVPCSFYSVTPALTLIRSPALLPVLSLPVIFFQNSFFFYTILWKASQGFLQANADTGKFLTKALTVMDQSKHELTRVQNLSGGLPHVIPGGSTLIRMWSFMGDDFG